MSGEDSKEEGSRSEIGDGENRPFWEKGVILRRVEVPTRKGF